MMEHFRFYLKNSRMFYKMEEHFWARPYCLEVLVQPDLFELQLLLFEDHEDFELEDLFHDFELEDLFDFRRFFPLGIVIAILATMNRILLIVFVFYDVLVSGVVKLVISFCIINSISICFASSSSTTFHPDLTKVKVEKRERRNRRVADLVSISELNNFSIRGKCVK